MTRSRWHITCGDCTEELVDWSRPADLVFADPPYDLGVDYQNDYVDSHGYDEFVALLRSWVQAGARPVSLRGSLWFLVPDEWAAETCLAMKSTGLVMRGWIKWYETFGVNCTRKFNRTSRHLLYFVRDPNQCIFNTEAVRVESARQRLGDKRANPRGKIMDDVWEVPRLVGNARERIKQAPTQLPVALMDRIILAVTEPGSLVIDPFVGTGTTGDAALRAGRDFWGVDLGQNWCDVSNQRLKPLGKQVSLKELLHV